jgi:phosphate transport system substrate-binding protein
VALGIVAVVGPWPWSSPSIQRFITGQTAMAVADRPLDETERDDARRRCEIQQLPFVAQPVWILYRLPVAGHLTLDAPTLAKIFSGAVTQWNDPAIVALNPGAGLGALPITVVGRSTDSTVTATFQQYLTTVGGWPTDAGPTFTGKPTLSARTEAETLSLIKSTDGAIGYLLPVESTGAFALRLGGVAPDPSEVVTTVNLVLPDAGLELDQEKLYRAGDGAYPLVILSYAVFCADDRTARDYLRSALTAVPTSAYVFPAYEWATRFGDALQ